MVEIGAGGGSIARVDKLRRIQVGPESAGSEPGPACYGRGGQQPAVTDADVRLGRVFPGTFAGGTFALDEGAAGRALHRGIAEPLSLDLDMAAWGVSEVVDENMAAAARAHAAEFGLDLASRDMVAFGGAAPLHAARLGEKLGVRRIVIPAAAGVGSAVGFLLAPVAYEVVRSRRQSLTELDPEVVNELMAAMHDEALAVVRQGVGSAVTDAELRQGRHAYMRYVGQGHEISVPLPVERYGEEHRHIFQANFESAYRRLYGRTIDGVEVEALSWTLTIARKGSASFSTSAREEQGADPFVDPPPPVARQRMFDPPHGKHVEAPVYLRAQLASGCRMQGPALITEDQTTTVVTSNYEAFVDGHGSIVLTCSDRAGGGTPV